MRATTVSPSPRFSLAPVSLALPVLLIGLSQPMTAAAQSGAEDAQPGFTPQLREVVVTSRRSLEDRFFATGSLVVVDRQDIQDMGVETVGDVLRQLPGVQVTPTASGGIEIRMRGMDSSATRVLVDGQRSSGRTQLPLDQLPAELIERIEVVRAPSAEFSGASGGTINFVLRQGSSKREGTVRLTDNHVWGQDAGQLFISHTGPLSLAGQAPAATSAAVRTTEPAANGNSGTSGNPENAQATSSPAAPPARQTWTYFMGLYAGGTVTGSDTAREQKTNDVVTTSGSATNRVRRNDVTLLPRLNGNFGPRDQLALRATLTDSSQDGQYLGSQAGAGNGGYLASSAETTRQERRYVQAAADWTHRLDIGKLETTISGNQTRENIDRHGQTVTTTLAGAPLGNRATRFNDDRQDEVWSLKTKLTGTKSSLLWMTGAEIETRRATALSQSGTAAAERLTADVQRQILWGQNEWELPGKTTLTAGLRGESWQLKSSSATLPAQPEAAPTQRLTFFQPSLHTRTPIGENTQWRANLSRITRNPGIWDLVDRTVPSQGGNSISNPDQVGNANLRPEIAQTLDVGIEHRLPQQGQMGLNLFVRALDDVIATRTTLVSSRWVEQRQNIGSATVWGLEADVKKQIDLPGLGRDWNFSAKASLLQSRMNSGPDQGLRIPGQARYLGSVSLSQPFRRSGGMFGGVSVSLTGPASLSREALSGHESSRAALDVYVGNSVPKLGYWRLGVYNLTDAGFKKQRRYQDGQGNTIDEVGTMLLTPRVYLSVGTQF